MFTIKIKRKALKKLAKLNPKQKRNIETIILILKNDPIPFKNSIPSLLRPKNNTDPLHRTKKKAYE